MFMRPMYRQISRMPYDSFYSQCAAAYSTRRMFSNYNGPLLTLRRSSDNATLDVGFVGGGDIDRAAIVAWMGSDSLFVSKWWDQSGHNRHVVQATLSKQPGFFFQGGINGRVQITFTAASSTELTCAGAGIAANTPHTMMALAQLTVTNGVFGGICAYGGPANNTSALGTTSGGLWWAGGRFNTLQAGQANDLNKHVFVKTVSASSGGVTHLYIDGADNFNGTGTVPTYTCTVGDFTIGAAAAGNSPGNCNVYECMFIPSVLSTTSRRNLEAIANAWAGLYDPLMYPASFLTNYHVFLIAGQSNALGMGEGIDYGLDVRDDQILQWACGGPFFHTAMYGRDPLHAPDILNQAIPGVGFGPSFAKAYRDGQELPSDTGVILVNAAVGGSGFSNTKWRVGDPYYNNALTYVNDCLANGPGTTRTIKGILWLQGEVDVTANYAAATYQTQLLACLDGLRTGITGGSATLPIMVGQMVPEWIPSQLNGPAIDAVHQAIPSLRTKTAFWTGPTNGYNSNAVAGGNIHYNAVGQRSNGTRAYAAYLNALVNG